MRVIIVNTYKKCDYYWQVTDLKKELKNRGLVTTGNKTELVERLQLAIAEGKFTLTLSCETYFVLVSVFYKICKCSVASGSISC